MSNTTSSTDSGERLDNTQMGGKRRRNGHKYSCKCPICINMKHAKRGGDNDELAENLEQQDSNISSQVAGRKKKSNGHKKNCGCPICQNMRKKKGGKNDDDDEDDDYYDEEDNNLGIGSQIAGQKKKGNGHKKNCSYPICKNMRKKGGDDDEADENVDMTSNETPASDEDYENMDNGDMSYISGGTRRRKLRKSRRNKKTRRNRRRSYRRRR